MNAAKKRCPLPFVIFLAALWFIRSMSHSPADGIPDRDLALVESPAAICVQVIPGAGS